MTEGFQQILLIICYVILTNFTQNIYEFNLLTTQVNNIFILQQRPLLHQTYENIGFVLWNALFYFAVSFVQIYKFWIEVRIFPYRKVWNLVNTTDFV